MEKAPKTPWYQNGTYVAGFGVATLLMVAGGIALETQDVAPAQPEVAGTAASQKLDLSAFETRAEPAKTQPKPQPKAVPLDNDNYYINSDGNKVHSPANTYDGSVPAGASARCRDGTYSFSQNRRGTCSHHGGVAQWL